MVIPSVHGVPTGWGTGLRYQVYKGGKGGEARWWGGEVGEVAPPPPSPPSYHYHTRSYLGLLKASPARPGERGTALSVRS